MGNSLNLTPEEYDILDTALSKYIIDMQNGIYGNYTKRKLKIANDLLCTIRHHGR